MGYPLFSGAAPMYMGLEILLGYLINILGMVIFDSPITPSP